MLPYHTFQIPFILGSALLTLGLFWLVTHLIGVRPLARFLLTELALGMFCGLGFLVADVVAQRETAARFSAVALSFYGGAFWLPLIAVFDGWRRERRVPRRLAMIGLVCVLTALYALLIEPNRLQVRRERCEVASLPEGQRPLRLVHISDLQTVGACEREARALRAINEWDPDLIVVTGDYVSGPFVPDGPAERAARTFLGGLRSRLGVVVVSGHSESEKTRERLFRDLDLIYLQNSTWRGELGDGRSFLVYGVDILQPRLPETPLARVPGQINIVASHVPDLTTRLSGLEVDLHLAGHTHGGQIVVPGFGPPVMLSSLERRYARGLHRYDDHWFDVAAGIGMEGHYAPRLRFFCPPEVVFLTLVGTGPGGDEGSK